MRRIKGSNIGELIRLLEKRTEGDTKEAERAVAEILADVKENGDVALIKYTEKFDGCMVDGSTMRLSEEEAEEAIASLDSELLRIVEESAENIREYHTLQKRSGFTLDRGNGAVLRQIVRPVDVAGIYVPGGKASYPSSVLMNAIPAKVAGVGRIVMATPAGRDGKLPPLTIAAAKTAGVDEIYKIGGAQAIAAFAYGTETVPRVDVVTGPGNVYVAIAKRMVFGSVGIDMIAGPSEVLVVADDSANPRYIAADFLSQAEHDARAACILVTDSEEMADVVEREIYAQAEKLPKKDVVFQSVGNYGTIVLTKDLAEAAACANAVAPEHMEICTKEPEQLLPLVKNAGSVFLGQYSPEPLGDYFAGANHVLPTNGTARFSSPLSVDDFVKKMSVIEYTEAALREVYGKVGRFAMEEGLAAHAKSAQIRFEEDR